MNKKIGIITYKNKPILLIEIKDITSEEDYNNLKKLCNTNLNELQLKQEEDKTSFKKGVNEKINTLAKAVKEIRKL